MQTIHHATNKRAIAASIDQAATDTGFVAHDRKTAMTTKGHDGAKAGDVLDAAILARVFYFEYPALTIVAAEGTWAVVHEDNDDNRTEVFRPGETPELADVFDICAEKDLDPEAIEATEEIGGRSIVPETYKRLYAASEVVGTCGDWLAGKLAFLSPAKGQFDSSTFLAICEQNGVDTQAPWAVSQTRGWQGRLRMTGRNLLTKRVATSGVLVLTDKSHKAPKAWCEANKPKPKKARAKKAA